MSAKKPKLAFKVAKTPVGVMLKPADSYTREWSAGEKPGSLIWATTHKPRSPQFHRAVHKLCSFLADHVPKFNGMEAHNVFKVLQLEAKLYCDTFLLTVPGFGTVMHLVPQSIAFDKMAEDEFRRLFDRLADHVAETHWPEFSLDLLNREAA